MIVPMSVPLRTQSKYSLRPIKACSVANDGKGAASNLSHDYVLSRCIRNGQNLDAAEPISLFLDRCDVGGPCGVSEPFGPVGPTRLGLHVVA